jgi:ubiquinone/menaquinone biosynthesis C-methylase UbiE
VDKAKQAVYEFWEKESCGENPYLNGMEKENYLRQLEIRYQLEPYILDFVDFKGLTGKKILEIGVGLGADHQKFAEAGAILHGIDLTDRAIEHASRRFHLLGLESNLQKADAEKLPFEDNSFDLVYSWGVLHHTPDIAKAINEIYRVLKPNGEVKVMIYHKYSFVGYMLWIRYALFKGKPMTSLNDIYNQYFESPGTKAFAIKEARELFSKFKDVSIIINLSYADLLESAVGRRHRGPFLLLAKLIWPRRIIRTFFPHYGLNLLITGAK